MTRKDIPQASFAMPTSPPEACAQSLARTLLLMRDHIRDDVGDERLIAALTTMRVVIAADVPNASSVDAQHAITTAALLSARCGARISLDIPDSIALLGPQAPLNGDRFGAALLDVLQDLLPGVDPDLVTGQICYDVAIIVGDSPWSGRATRVLRLQADAWAGAFTSAGGGTRWSRCASAPFGPLAAGGLAAGEVFKSAMAKLRHGARDFVEFDGLFSASARGLVRLAPLGSPLPQANLDEFDLISGGAIIQAALFALGRLDGIRGHARLIEPETSEVTNLNRYALLRRSRLTMAKANHIADLAHEGAFGGLSIDAVVARYDGVLAQRLSTAPAVLVGVDDIPSRWVVQAQHPSWLGVGATSHYLSMASYHSAGLGCARCLHPEDDPTQGPIPTVAFVSHWAGLWLAAMFVRARSGIQLSLREQSVFMTALRAESPAAVWFAPVPRRGNCPNGCAAA